MSNTEMSDIPVTKIIRINNPNEYKLHAARRNNDDEQPLDVFVRDKDDWRGWNAWRNQKNEFNRHYIFSLMDFYHESDMWLFGGIYEVIERIDIGANGYVIKDLEQYSCYVGRLKIQMLKPSRGRAFKL